ncbi:MAG: UDP-3-O-acyl-N-acetylglucosamine deacetylase [Candidatus Omnitrophica bacterium]|nr:UDP-3-O-acyl-N-acetylglucosamine deacetylase [Candidatus Omnitrophota bacterium]
MTQKTVGKQGSVSGTGIHTGGKCTVVFEPAPPDSGVRFFRHGKRVGARAEKENGLAVAETSRSTTIGDGRQKVRTVEHLLAALSGLEICNVRVDVDGEEIPALDGSASEFVRFLKTLGAEEFSVAYTLDYEHPFLRKQTVDFVVNPGVFERELAPARTFCLREEAPAMKARGLGLGATAENTLVISPGGATNDGLRYPDECARHKALDLLGDLNLLGVPLVGRVVGLRSGHSLNCRLVELLSADIRERKQRGGYDQ